MVIPTPFSLGRAAAENLGAFCLPLAKANEAASKTNRSAEMSLIQQAQRGDSGAVTELYDLHAGEIYRYCLLRVNDQAVAEDLTAEVFLKALEGLPRYVYCGAPFVAWLYRIAHDRVVDYQRRKVRRPAEALSETIADGRPAPEDQALRRVEAGQLKQAMAGLRDEQQTVLQLRFVEGHSLKETAELMGKTTGAVKAMQIRALRQLAQQLGKARFLA